MKLLLDTHIFLWYISGNSKLHEPWKIHIQDPTNEVYLSVASVWETTIKYQMGKLPLPAPADRYLPEQRIRHQISSLLIDEPTIAQLSTLPSLHRDPCDRILISQALQHDLILLTVDGDILRYPMAKTLELDA
jgi:PIN domain nuclease of toxin-antitoxin system